LSFADCLTSKRAMIKWVKDWDAVLL